MVPSRSSSLITMSYLPSILITAARNNDNRGVSHLAPPPTSKRCIYLPHYLAAADSQLGRWRSPVQTFGMAGWCQRCWQPGRGSGSCVQLWGHGLDIYTPLPGHRCIGPRCQCQPRTCGARQWHHYQCSDINRHREDSLSLVCIDL